jgi:hypothetical protein
VGIFLLEEFTREGGDIAYHTGFGFQQEEIRRACEGGKSCMQIAFTRGGGGSAGGRRSVRHAYCFHTWRGKDLEANGFPGRVNEKNESRGG